MFWGVHFCPYSRVNDLKAKPPTMQKGKNPKLSKLGDTEDTHTAFIGKCRFHPLEPQISSEPVKMGPVFPSQNAPS